MIFSVAALSAADARPRIITSFLPLHSWSLNIAGTNAIVENLLPARVEPHEYAFTPGDARRLAQADLIIVNGLGLEAWVPKFLRSTPAASNRLLSIAAGFERSTTLGSREHPNPHIWLDPQLAAQGVSNISAALQRIDPPHASAYEGNARAYLARLRQLDSDIQQSLAGITNRALVTYHDAFPYFARRYGLGRRRKCGSTGPISPRT